MYEESRLNRGGDAGLKSDSVRKLLSSNPIREYVKIKISNKL
jgi:hypothetical protein